MFTAESLGALLHSLATGNPGRAENMVQTSDELSEEERPRLWQSLKSSDVPAIQARNLGDAIRTGTGWDFSANECYRAAFYLGQGVEELRSDPLFGYFSTKKSGRVLDKWIHYFPVYSRHFAAYRGRSIRILEVGVYRGGSLDMWNWYFGPEAKLVGIDIDERAKETSDPRHVIEIGDQTDAEFLRKVSEKHGPFDIIIDDGGHEMHQQIITAETLYPLLAEGGVFLVEDTHTSYWDHWGGGKKREGTFIEWSKARVDDLNGYHQPAAIDPVWTGQVDSMHFYDSIVVLEKRQRFAPFAEQVGHSEFLNYPRSTAQLITEVLATREAALVERDHFRDAAEGGNSVVALEEEVRLLRGELRGLRPQAAALGDRLRKAKAELDVARSAVRTYRKRSAEDANPVGH
jgi:hypothetical protein